MKGAREEQLALDHLLARGLRLVARNYRAKTGELDLVLRDGDTLVIAEVRKRAHTAFASGAESVDARKQRRIAQTAQWFLSEHPEFARCPVRFDVLALDASDRIDWIRDAFSAES
jgi:putative endonuclease